MADDALVDKYNLFILEAVRIWIDPHRAERRALHHQGDGSFAVDGPILDLGDRMVKWRDLQE